MIVQAFDRRVRLPKNVAKNIERRKAQYTSFGTGGGVCAGVCCQARDHSVSGKSSGCSSSVLYSRLSDGDMTSWVPSHVEITSEFHCVRSCYGCSYS